MGIFSKFENKMEDTFDEIGDKVFDSPISPVQIAKKCEKEMRRGKMVGTGKQYAPTLYTILVNVEDDRRLTGYYPTLAGETETYLEAKANEQGLALDGHPLVRFIADESLKHGKFDVVAEPVAGVIVEQLRAEENERYGISNKPEPKPAGAAPNVAPAPEPAPAAPSAFAPYDVDAADAAADQLNQNAPATYDAGDGFGEVAAKPNPAPEPVSEPVKNPAPEPAPAPVPAQSAPAPEPVPAQPQPAPAPQPVPAAPAPAPEPQVAQPAATPKPNPQPEPVNNAQQTPMSAAPTQIFQPATQNVTNGIPPAHFRDMATGRVYAITQENTIIGRDRTCNLCLDDVNASRQHAKLQYSGGMWILTDMNSTNGTYINDIQITSRQILPGDVATVGITNLEFNVG